MRENNRNDKRNFERRDGKKRDFKGKRDYRDRDRKQEVQQADEEFLRRTAELTLDGMRCALCLDDGMLLGAARRRPFCEVELELVSGEAAPMLAFAAYLQEHHALREERKSKFVRASELAE